MHACQFEQIQGCTDIDIFVEERLGKRGPDAGPRSQVDDLPNLVTLEGVRERLLIPDVDFN